MQATIQRLIEMGGKEWRKHGHHRVYFDATVLARIYGLTYNGFHHRLDGEVISGGRAGAIGSALMTAKVYYDLRTNSFAARGLADWVAERLMPALEAALEATVEVAEEPAPVAEPTPVGATVRTSAGAGIQRRPVRTNRYAGHCVRCGGHVPAGAGHTYYIDPDEAYEHSGWVVEHTQCR